MFLHPSVHLELARQRHQELLAAAEHHRIVKASADRKAVLGLRAGRPSDSRLDKSWFGRQPRHASGLIPLFLRIPGKIAPRRRAQRAVDER